jgi:hypothetical protein
MTILEKNLHSFLIEEHDPMLYEDAKTMVEYIRLDQLPTTLKTSTSLLAIVLDL